MEAGQQAMETAVTSGTWFIVQTSLPLWRTRRNPSVTYAPLPDGRVVDTVQFGSGARRSVIVGLDRAVAGGGFEWRGVGVLTRFTPSRWRVLAAGDGWAVTVFTRTPFTPAGMDVYARSPQLTDPQAREVAAALERLPEAQPFLGRLFAPAHDPR